MSREPESSHARVGRENVRAFMDARPLKFHGEPAMLEMWILNICTIFETCRIQPYLRVKLAAMTLRGEAFAWWSAVNPENRGILEMMLKRFRDKFSTPGEQALRKERLFKSRISRWHKECTETIFQYTGRYVSTIMEVVPEGTPDEELITPLLSALPSELTDYLEPPVKGGIHAVINYLYDIRVKEHMANTYGPELSLSIPEPPETKIGQTSTITNPEAQSALPTIPNLNENPSKVKIEGEEEEEEDPSEDEEDSDDEVKILEPPTPELIIID